MEDSIPVLEIDLDSNDEATMDMVLNGRPTGWLWTFAGQGNPKAIEQANRLAKEHLRRDAEIERARNNGKQWKSEVERPSGSSDGWATLPWSGYLPTATGPGRGASGGWK